MLWQIHYLNVWLKDVFLLNGPLQEFRSGILLRINRYKLAEETDARFSCQAAGGIILDLYGKNNYNGVRLYMYCLRDIFSRVTENSDKIVFGCFSFKYCLSDITMATSVLKCC